MPDERFTHAYFDESRDPGKKGSRGFDLVNSQGLWDFELSDPHAGGDEPDPTEPKPSVASTAGPVPEGNKNPTSRVTAKQISGAAPATLEPRKPAPVR